MAPSNLHMVPTLWLWQNSRGWDLGKKVNPARALLHIIHITYIHYAYIIYSVRFLLILFCVSNKDLLILDFDLLNLQGLKLFAFVNLFITY